MAMNLARSSSGTSSRSASDNTRTLKSSQDSSRLSNRASLMWATVGSVGRSALFGFGVLRKAEVPIEQQTLALGIPHDPLAIAAGPRVAGGQKCERAHHPRPDLVDPRPVAEVRVDLPVGRD